VPANTIDALVQGHIVLEARTSKANLLRRIDRAYFGHEMQTAVSGSAAS
jgi:hypothetical protein